MAKKNEIGRKTDRKAMTHRNKENWGEKAGMAKQAENKGEAESKPDMRTYTHTDRHKERQTR